MTTGHTTAYQFEGTVTGRVFVCDKGQSQTGILSAGTTDGEDPFVLGVDIKQLLALDEAVFQRCCTSETGFLVGGKK